MHMILDEAKADFPLDLNIWLPWAESHMKILSLGENPNPKDTDHAQMIIWFAKWLGYP